MFHRFITFTCTIACLTLLSTTAYSQPAGTVLHLDAADTSTVFDEYGSKPDEAAFTGNVVKWADKSASGNVVVLGEGQPTYAGGAVVFDGREHLIDSSPTGLPTGNGARHMFFAGKPTDMPIVNTYLNFGPRAEGSAWFNTFLYDSDDDDVGRSYYAGWGNDVASENQLTSINDRVILEFSADGTTGTWHHNGDFDHSAAFSTNTGVGALRIGTEEGESSLSNYDMYEILLYDSALSDADRNAAGAYLANKWNITTSYVPEPSSLLLLSLAVGSLTMFRIRRSWN